MNIIATTEWLYIHQRRLEALAEELAKGGSALAAEELSREAYKLGCQISQLDAVLSDHELAIAATLQEALNENPPRLIDVDIAIPGADRTVVKGVNA